jgi:flagellar hook-associated protein 2
MSTINLGGFNTSNGNTTALGFLSNLDGDSIIEAILSAKQNSIDETQDTVDSNKEKISAIGELQTLLDRLKTTSNFLRSPPGVFNESNDFFKHTTASISSSTSTAASTYLSVVSEPGATLNDYSIENINLAKAHQVRKDGFTSKTTSVVGNASVTDNYQVSTGTVSGSVLNSTTPITFSNDVQGNKATVDLVFSDDNEFDGGDNLSFGSTTITFGGSGGDDVAVGATISDTLTNIVSYLNSVTTGEEALYDYSTDGSTITVTRDVEGSNDEVNTSLTIGADFSTGGTTNQTVAIGSQAASNNPAGGDLNSLGTDGDQGTVATSAVLEVIFGTENQFDAEDELTIGGTTITFGGTGGDDIDISAATTLDDKIDAIVSHMNSVASGTESTYTYSRDSSGILTITQDTTGTIASTGNDMNVSANFSSGTADTTQTVQIGKNYKNNGSVDGSVAKSNGLVSGSVSQNGVDGSAAASKATIDVVIANNNIDTNDTITFGGTTATFGVDITVGADLAETLDNIVTYFNNLTSGDEADYKFENDGATTITITKNDYGSGATLALGADFSLGADTANTVAIGSQAAANNPAAGTLDVLGTDGVDQTSITDVATTHIPSLSGSVTIDSAKYIAGASTADSFTSNSVEFKATVGGVTYTSKPVLLDGGDINAAGDGDNGLGNRIPSGTVITFVKDSDTDTTAETKDVTFQLVVGDEKIVDNAAEASTYATEINTWLNTTNSISITQSPTVPEFRAGTFNLGGVDITLQEGDNLSVIKSKINAVSSLSGVQADIVQVSDSNFSLILKSTNAGVENKIFEFADGDVGDGPSGTLQIGLDNVSFTEIQAAQDASFDLDGQTITRSTNTINDVIDNLTFTLKADTPDATPTTINLNIASDNELIKTGINDFLTAYNDLKLFISEQTERDENNDLVETAILGDEAILRDVLTSVEDQLSRTVEGISSSGFNSLFEVGIDLIDFPGNDETPETKDIFVIDDDKFDAAIAANFDAVREVFAFSFNANSPDLGVFSHTNKTTLNDYVLDIDTSRADGDKVRVLSATDNSFLFNATLSGSSIKGQEGTSLEGLVLVYTGDGSDTITISQSIGIVDGLYNLLDGYLKDDGFVDDAIDSVKSENDRLLDRIERDNITLEIERQLLVEQFTRLEAVISSANNTLSFIDAQNQANNNR